MSDIKVGDIVLCVKSGYINGVTEGNTPPLRKGAEYSVNAINTCGCGHVSLDIGLGILSDSRGVMCSCGGVSSPTTGIWWCAAERFVKKQTNKSKEELEEELADAIEKEDYVAAAKLKRELETIII